MTIADIYFAIRKSLAAVIAIITIGVAAAVGLFFITPATYSSTAQAFVSTQASGTNAELVQGSSFAQKRVQSYAQLVSRPIVLDPAINELGLDTTAAKLAKNVRASSPLNTVLVNIAYTSGDPKEAQRVAEAVANSFITVVSDLEKPSGGGESPVKVTLSQPATFPSSPDSPKLLVNIAAGLMLGTLLAVGFAILRSIFDTRTRDVHDVKAIVKSPLLGEVRLAEEFVDANPPVHEEPTSLIAEEFRQVRTNMMFIKSASDSNIQMFTSAIQGEGKTTIACNLALSYAQNGQRVCIIDCDLRRPNVARYLGIEGSVGLTTALIGEAVLRDVVQRWGTTNLWVLPSGQVPPNPSELLGSPALVEALRLISEKFDIVIVDAPPLVPVADSTILASKIDNIILVAGCDKVRKPQMQQAVDKLNSVQREASGVIVNRAGKKAKNSYGYYQEYKQDPQTA